MTIRSSTAAVLKTFSGKSRKRKRAMLQKINELIAANSSFLITSHESPDGDAIGSSLALANYLKEIGKDVTVHICDPVPDIYRFLPLADTVLAVPSYRRKPRRLRPS